MAQDRRLALLRDILIDSAIEYLRSEVSDKSINAARAVLKDLTAPDDGYTLSDKQVADLKEAMGPAPFSFG